MIIKTKLSLYEVYFNQVQIEITGLCNMRCEHCRNSFDRTSVMPLKEISKIIKFARKNGTKDLELVLSGGEPLLHPNFREIISEIKNQNIRNLFFTTNGSLLREEHIPILRTIKNTMVSVSLDDIEPEKHDEFRNFKGAHKAAISTIELLVKSKINVSIRVSLVPRQIKNMKKISEFAYRLGVKRLSISSIFPSGKGQKNKKIIMSPAQKKNFLTNIFKLRKYYLKKGMKITTNDPLQNLCRESSQNCDDANIKEITLNGCGVAASFNVMANGNLTPCAMLNLPILNTVSLTLSEIQKKYKQSDIVKNLLDMNTSGKCGKCKLRYRCGGCRARAYAHSKNYLGEDPDCWM